jgi:hypothetical protein
MVIVDYDGASMVVEVENVLVNAVLLGQIDARSVLYVRFRKAEILVGYCYCHHIGKT